MVVAAAVVAAAGSFVARRRLVTFVDETFGSVSSCIDSSLNVDPFFSSVVVRGRFCSRFKSEAMHER
jgi:hypothetical protein